MHREDAGSLPSAEHLRGEPVAQVLLIAAEGQLVNQGIDQTVPGIEGGQAALGAQVEGILRGRIFAAIDAAGVAELRGVGDRLGEGVGSQPGERFGNGFSMRTNAE